MAMLEVVCRDCDTETSLRGYLEKEDLKGTKYEHLMDTITELELFVLQNSGKVKDQWDRFMESPVCPECGSKNVYCQKMFVGFRKRKTSMEESGKTTFMKAFMQLAGEKLSIQETEFELNLEPFYFEDELIQAVNTKKNSERALSNGNG